MGPDSNDSYGLDTSSKRHLRRTFTAFELFFTGAFTLELALNMLSRSAREFWCSGWNLFDFFIVFSSLFDCLGPCRPRHDLAPCCDVVCPASASSLLSERAGAPKSALFFPITSETF